MSNFASRSRKGRGGFTLIELLVVISIIGLLAALTLGLSSVASTRKKIETTKAKLRQIELALDSYKASIGSYPPDAKFFNGSINTVTNQLFYELSGTFYQNGHYIPNLGGEDLSLKVEDYKRFFGKGIQNTAMEAAKTRSFLGDFESKDYASLPGRMNLSILVAPVKWPSLAMLGTDFDGRALESYRPIQSDEIVLRQLNPFQYRSSGRDRFNQASYDLWVDVPVGRKKIYRVNNWSQKEIVIGNSD